MNRTVINVATGEVEVVQMSAKEEKEFRDSLPSIPIPEPVNNFEVLATQLEELAQTNNPAAIANGIAQVLRGMR